MLKAWDEAEQQARLQRHGDAIRLLRNQAHPVYIPQPAPTEGIRWPAIRAAVWGGIAVGTIAFWTVLLAAIFTALLG